MSSKSIKSLVDSPNWELHEQLGSGGQAVALRAVRRDDQKTQGVVKVLKPWSDESKASSEMTNRSRFVREIVTLEDLALQGCPNVVPVLDKDIQPAQGFQPWYAMPFYERGPMRKLGDDGKPIAWAEAYEGDVDRVLQIAHQLAKTLAFMHERNTVHRDVHTSNVFLTIAGEPVLGDFGLVSSESTPDHRTAADEPIGPWHWRPPELRIGNTNKHYSASDVYMLGGLIYEALTGGEYLDDPQTPDGSFKHVVEPACSLSRYCEGDLLARLQELLVMCWHRRPEHRISSDKLHAQLDALVSRKTPKNIDAEELLVEVTEAQQEYERSAGAIAEAEIAPLLVAICSRVAENIRNLTAKTLPTSPINVTVAAVERVHHPQYIEAPYDGVTFAAVEVSFRRNPTKSGGPKRRLTTFVVLARDSEGKEYVSTHDHTDNFQPHLETTAGDPQSERLMVELVTNVVKKYSSEAASWFSE